MDKYEKKVRVNQIVSCIKNGEYTEAQEIADTIDWRQERSIRTLRMVSEVYKINRRYDDALTVLNLAYEKNPEDPIKRKIIYDLCELAIKMGQFGVAVRYMKEFSRMAPRDPGRYILQYRLLKATDADYGERIELLEEFKRKHFGDVDGKWAYELAYLYHLTGKSDKCVECCNEIALWFVTGPIVIKALKLKKEHQELTYEEEQKIISAEGGTGEEVLYQKRHKTETGPVYMDTTPVIGDGYSTTDVEDRMQPEPDTKPAYTEQPPRDMMPQSGLNIEVKRVDASFEPTIRMAEKKTGPSIMSRETMVLPDINKSAKTLVPSEEPPEPVMPHTEYEAPAGAEPVRDIQKPEISVQPAGPAIPGVVDDITQTGTIAQQEISINLDKFSTMNLQAELRENMEKLQEETGEPLREKEEKLPERTAEPDRELTELTAGSKDVSGDDAPEEPEPPKVPEPEPVRAPEPDGVSLQEEPQSIDADADISSKITSIPVPDQFKNMLSQDYDGQMQLNVPDEEPAADKQITGQMDIESILAEWDKPQEEAKERRIRAAKKKSLEQTNELAKKLAGVIPGLELPKGDDEPKTTPAPEPAPAPAPELPSSFTAPLVAPDNETDGIDITKIEEALEADINTGDAPDGAPEDTEKETAEPAYEDDQPYDEPGSKDDDKEPESEPEPEAESEPEPEKKKTAFVSYDTVELPSVFDTFRKIKGLPIQLKEAEEKLSMEASHGNILIIGSEHAARMELVSAIVRDMRGIRKGTR